MNPKTKETTKSKEELIEEEIRYWLEGLYQAGKNLLAYDFEGASKELAKRLSNIQNSK